MKASFQELLLFIPMYQLTFITPLPKELIYYDTISEVIPNGLLEKPTLLIINSNDEYRKLNDVKVASQLIQDTHLIGIVLCIEDNQPFQEKVITLFRECQIPMIKVTDCTILPIFQQKNELLFSYGLLSQELMGTMEVGFIKLASELAKGLETPLLYLDENNQLLWYYGEEDELREANRWLNIHRKELENRNYTNSFLYSEATTEKATSLNSFELYAINIAGLINQTLLASANLVDWQKKLVDKLVGLTALLLQTEKVFEEQQEEMKEHFVYDLLYHKFESHSVMVKQGKTWGWNLEVPHHLFIINVSISEESMISMNWMDEIIIYIESRHFDTVDQMNVFSFQDQIVILIEDSKNQTINQRKNQIVAVGNQLVEELCTHWPHCQFSIGIGKWYQDTTYLNKSYQEAKLALKFGDMWFQNKKVYHIHDLGVLRLLIQIHPEILFDFSEEYLQSLIDSDRHHGTEYIKTLQAYIQCQGRIMEVSDSLFVHPNTLRNRIKKMEEMVGIDFQDPEEFMNLIVAVKLLSFLK